MAGSRLGNEALQALIQYATPTQERYLRAVIEHGTHGAAARSIGVGQTTISHAIAAVERNAARRGFAPGHGFTHEAPPGFLLERASTLIKADGSVGGQWLKIKADEERRMEMARTFGEELALNVDALKRIKVPKKAAKDLMTGYPIGDHHYGMYAHEAETGGNYDLKIAKQRLAAAIDELVTYSPPAQTAVLASMGDLLHADNRTNQTPTNHHQLDVDTRFWKVARVAAYGMAHAGQRLLEKHETVYIYVIPGNHDPDSSIWIALMLEAFFRHNPRVKVCTSPSMFLYHQFGANMIGMTHGHTVKLDDLPAIMAAQQPKMWGDTLYRVCWTGHGHHRERYAEKEGRGATPEMFRVLPPNDQFGASRGFSSMSEMQSITFKQAGGELCRFKHNPGLQ